MEDIKSLKTSQINPLIDNNAQGELKELISDIKTHKNLLEESTQLIQELLNPTILQQLSTTSAHSQKSETNQNPNHL